MSEINKFHQMIVPIAAAGALLALSGCARQESRGLDVTSEVEHSTDIDRNYGFWPGLIHGTIAPISFVGEMIFNDGEGDDIVMYSPDNNGKPYTAGFAIGAGILLSGGSSASRRRDY